MAKCVRLVTAALLGCLLLMCFPVEASTLVGDEWDFGIHIFSPANATYTQNQLVLNVTAKRYINPAYYNTEIKYSLNTAENTTVPTTTTYVPHAPVSAIYGDISSYSLISSTATLPELPQGTCNLTVYAQYTRKEGTDLKWPDMYDAQTVQFTINLGVPPTVTLHSPNSASKIVGEEVAVNFAVEGPVNWMGYSLDGQAKVTVSGNLTLTNLETGKHSVTVYAMDTVGNVGVSETAYFAVAETEQTQLWLLSAVAVVAIAVFWGVLVLYSKRRHYFGVKI